jgi:hypothetical protein
MIQISSICFLHDRARDIAKHPIDTTELVRFFQMNARSVRRNPLHAPGSRNLEGVIERLMKNWNSLLS